MKDWYTIDNPDAIDTPALILYPKRVEENIRILKTILADTNRLRPHVKTHKSADVSAMLIRAGISKFKCATIAEAEMLAQAGAADVVLAYQPVGPKAGRFLHLAKKFPATKFACLIDDLTAAKHLSDIFAREAQVLSVFIDLNIGMNRTGIIPQKAEQLLVDCNTLSGITVTGLHAYDGHIRDADLNERTKKCNEAFGPVEDLADSFRKRQGHDLVLIAGGTPTFPIHAKRKNVECSPGTFVYWDIGYSQLLTEQPYLFGALVLTRVVSKPTDDTLCLDLGHKSIASENTIDKRVHFLNAPDLQAIGHSEEHLIVRVSGPNKWQVGDVLYGVPYHICPTCALYDVASAIEDHTVAGRWPVTSRKRMITV